MTVVGVGTPDRSDDAVGLVVAERVAALGAREVVRLTSPLDLVEAVEGVAAVVVVDGVRSGAPAGTVTVTVLGDEPLPARKGGGTHGLGVAEALELARATGRLPARVVLVGVEVADVGTGAGLSAPVAAAVDVAVAAVLRESATAAR